MEDDRCRSNLFCTISGRLASAVELGTRLLTTAEPDWDLGSMLEALRSRSRGVEGDWLGIEPEGSFLVDWFEASLAVSGATLVFALATTWFLVFMLNSIHEAAKLRYNLMIRRPIF